MDIKNGLIIGASIIVAALIIIGFMPRYQYVSETTNRTIESGWTTQNTEQYIFDMVSGKLHKGDTLVTIFGPNGSVRHTSRSTGFGSTERNLIDIWEAHRKACGEGKVFNQEQWEEWKRDNNW